MHKNKGNRILLLMALWLGILGSFAFWFEINSRHEERALAMSTAKTLFQQNLISRKWNARHGGVYIPFTTEPQSTTDLPPEHLLVLTADNGLKLQKIEHVCMSRQMVEMAVKEGRDLHFHTTSLNPIRPENKATEWEGKWLKSFEQGGKEQGEFFDDGVIRWFRYMAPLFVEPECLKCHAQQGYKEGDIRGGISISQPYPPRSHLPLVTGFGSVAIIGLVFIFIGNTLYERKRRLFDATFNSPTPTSITDINHTILLANEGYWAKFGARPDKHKTIKCYEHRPGTSCHTETCPLTMIMAGASTYTYEDIKEKDGGIRHFLVTAKSLLDAKGKVVGIVESFQEITERKQAEKALEESNRLLEALSITDSLTGIANRRRFDAVLAREYSRHARSGAALSLLLLDIDHFKLFNDCYGHVAGDDCLRQVAQTMADCIVRPTDLAARYGGEEFICILPETDSSGAIALAEKIRQSIIALAIPHQESPVADCVTASLGVVTVPCTVGGSTVDIITKVDQQLYLAKAAGRNQIKFTNTYYVENVIQGGNLAQLTWKNAYCCGNERIDSQHQTLFHLSNELLEAVISTRPATEISAIITRLLTEVKQHFHDEETILAAAGFPGLSQHVAEHAKLLARGLELIQEFKTSTLMLGDVFQFLVSEVIMRHMLKADREYFPFINKTGAAE